MQLLHPQVQLRVVVPWTMVPMKSCSFWASQSRRPIQSRTQNLTDWLPYTTTAAPRGSLDKDLRHKMFGSSDESENSSPGSKRSRSHSYKAILKHDDVSPLEDVAESSRSHRIHSRSNTRYRGARGARSYVGTAQEEQDRNALLSTPQNKRWMPTLCEVREGYVSTNGSCRIPLFDSSRIHGLDASAKDYRTEHEFYIDIFLRHR